MEASDILEQSEISDSLDKMANLPKQPTIIEAFWDGDSYGWRVHVVAIAEEFSEGKSVYEQHFLAVFSCTPSDWNLPKYESLPSIGGSKALELASFLASKAGVLFYFPSADEPRDECAR